MTLSDFKVIVIGAGIGGLAAALALRARGADVTVCEQAPAITEVGAGLQVTPNGLAVLRALGLEAALSRDAVQAAAVVLRDHSDGAEVLRLDLARLAAGQRYCFIHRADLIGCLADAARAAGVRILTGRRAETVAPGLRPDVTFADGARMEADLVVGADGLHSRARRALGEAGRPFFTGQVAWRATVDVDGDIAPEASVFMGPGRHLVTYPLRGGRMINLVAVQERAGWTAEGWHHEGRADDLRAAFADFGGAAAGLLARVGPVGIWGLYRHDVADCWQRDGVAILGDAAHPTLPFMAQGANLALEDAWVLADCLAGAGRRDEGLAAYQQRRAARARRVVAAAGGNAWKYHLRPPLRGAAHLALRVGGRIAPGRMVRQFDWIYGHDVTAGGGRGRG
ncbi:FAD-dependent monooxygenase [Pontibaca methylaminivorans]|uniref:FAD-dependent monooxygenase n=1 Tax=Pontibaca methylaminivorans TaxID=515897 RepID=UPI0009776FD8|nr:FAD-dependent monooxygenase [Pontibaca methylaminivorans]